jgi:hypothetical protein
MSTSARLILGLAMSLIAPAANPSSPPSSVVIAELFTSEGGSSCPPADTLVRQPGRPRAAVAVNSVAVARVLAPLGALSDRDRTFAGTVDVPIARYWTSRNLQNVGVIQERDSRRIIGAGAAETSFRSGSDQ